MSIVAGPFDGGSMAQAQWREVESKLWSDGVILGARNAFATTTTTGLGISVNTGNAVLDGFRFYADSATALTAAAADPSLPRIDLVVLRIDESAHTATIAIKTGTPASSPAAPTATKTVGGTWELGIYQLRVNAGATTIASLTDVRSYAAPGNAVSKGGDTSTGRQNVSLALGGSIQEFFRLTATDGKIYALCIIQDGTFCIRNITDGVNVLVLGPTVGTIDGAMTFGGDISGEDATFSGAVTAAAFHGLADSASAATALKEDGGKLLTAHVSGSVPSQFFLLVTPQPAGDAVALGARVWDGSASHDVTVVNSDGTINGAVQVSYFSGTGAGTFSHGLGTTPSWVGITDSQGGSSMTVGATSYGSSTVTINTGASHTWKGIAIK